MVLETEPVACCPMCSSAKRAESIERVEDWFFQVVSGEWSFARCAACQSLFLDPRPTQETIGAAYQNYYTHSDSLGSANKPPFSDRPNFRQLVRDGLINTLINSRFGLRLKPNLGFPLPFLIAKRLVPQSVVERYRHFPKLPRGSKVLDVGCGSGKFVRRLVAAGVDAYGVDFDPAALEASQIPEAKILLGSVSTAKEFGVYFDAITFNHVIEHLPNIEETLIDAFRLLAPAGFLHLEYPNPIAPAVAKYGKYWRGLEAPRHLCLPSSHSMERLLKSIGFSEVRMLAVDEQKTTKAIDAASERAAKADDSMFSPSNSRTTNQPTFVRLLAWK